MENQFKVGDWVYFMDNPKVASRTKDYIMQVLDIDSRGWLMGVWSTTGKENGHKYIHYRYATQEEIAKVTGKLLYNYEIY